MAQRACGAKSVAKTRKLGSNVLVRYLVKELFLYFFISFLFFFMIFFVNEILLLAETILKQRVPVGTVVRLIAYSLPGIIAQSSSFATLVGFLMCLGRLVSDNEILILRASGLKYRIIMIPVVILGAVISIASFFVNDYLLPVGTLKFNRLKKEIVHTNPAVELESNSIKRTNDSTLVIGEVDKNRVSDLVVFDSENGSQRIIIAENSSVEKSDLPGILMELKMNDATVLFFDRTEKKTLDALFADTVQLNVFTSAFIDSSNRIAPREMTSYDLRKVLQEMEKDKNLAPKSLNNYRVEYNKKFSLPFASLFFAILALPLALVFGKREGQTIGLIIGLMISVLYWTLSILGQIFGIKIGLNGFWAMWTPNFVIGAAGIVLYMRLIKK